MSFSLTAGLLALSGTLFSQGKVSRAVTDDSDRDGLSDTLEQKLLQQFEPTFLVGAEDCSVRPAEFKAGVLTPLPIADNGTVYGQVFPVSGVGRRPGAVEIHYYHLWRRDCGEHGHPLDTEHVATLVEPSEPGLATATWTAVYWYAAAHENTVCDVSQIARASTLDAVHHGATVWISPGKHASYLNSALCQRGCGADRCEAMVALPRSAPVNLGELGSPMNGSTFIASDAWPLAAKMSSSNFPSEAIARLDHLPATEIAWFRPGRHPAQGIIAKSSSTEQVLADSSRSTTGALSTAGSSTADVLANSDASTGDALATASDDTGRALRRSYGKTRHALGSSASHVGRALHLTPAPATNRTEQPE